MMTILSGRTLPIGAPTRSVSRRRHQAYGGEWQLFWVVDEALLRMVRPWKGLPLARFQPSDWETSEHITIKQYINSEVTPVAHFLISKKTAWDHARIFLETRQRTLAGDHASSACGREVIREPVMQ